MWSRFEDAMDDLDVHIEALEKRAEALVVRLSELGVALPPRPAARPFDRSAWSMDAAHAHRASEAADLRQWVDSVERAVAEASGAPPLPEVTPPTVFVYHLGEQDDDVGKVARLLEEYGIAHVVRNIRDDPAMQFALLAQIKTIGLPLVCVGNECVGSLAEIASPSSAADLSTRIASQARVEHRRR